MRDDFGFSGGDKMMRSAGVGFLISWIIWLLMSLGFVGVVIWAIVRFIGKYT